MLVYTTQVKSAFHARLLASSEVISQVLFTSEESRSRRKTKWLLSVYSQIKLLFGPLVIQLVWYIHHYSPPLWRIIVNYIYNIWLFINSVPNKYNRAEYIRSLNFFIVIIFFICSNNYNHYNITTYNKTYSFSQA